MFDASRQDWGVLAAEIKARGEEFVVIRSLRGPTATRLGGESRFPWGRPLNSGGIHHASQVRRDWPDVCLGFCKARVTGTLPGLRVSIQHQAIRSRER
jgi:hypothetical protein